MARYKILLTESISQVGIDLLRGKGDVVVAPSPSESDVIPFIKDADALLVRSSRVTSSMMEAGERLKVIGRHGIGTDNIDLSAATRLGIKVVNTPDANTNAVAEHTIWAILHCARNFNKAEKDFRSGVFCRAGSLPGLVQNLGYSTLEICGKTLGLVGMGRIARRVAGIAANCFHMRVKSYDPLVPDKIFAALGVERVYTLDAALERADFISLHLPYSKGVHHLIGERELLLIKPDAYLINTSRGGIIDEEALYRALKEGRLAGAALDVFEEEPPAKDMKLFELDNVLLTPHMAAMTDLALQNMAVDVANGILDVLENRNPKYLVNPEVANFLEGFS
ncbi:MAG: hydroxyacid dehydrogenase [Peptococcaceae bacterium]|nr:hydroxyacid dehydrogenase [Peptococcaceae bacterium]